MNKQLEVIKAVLTKKRMMITCDECRFEWVPMGEKFQDTCPHCNKIQGLSRQDSLFLSLYDDNEQNIDEL